jgi:hypothetical protein
MFAQLVSTHAPYSRGVHRFALLFLPDHTNLKIEPALASDSPWLHVRGSHSPGWQHWTVPGTWKMGWTYKSGWTLRVRNLYKSTGSTPYLLLELAFLAPRHLS